MEKPVAIIPTLGRPSLQEAVKSLESSTVVMPRFGDDDMITKMRDAVNEVQTETIVIADDDANYPEGWVAQLGKSYGEGVGFVGGPCLALLNDSSSDAEKCIAEVTSSWWGTTNMSYRTKTKGKVRNADETNLVGNGLYRRELFAKVLNEDADKIPPAAWENYVFTRIRKMGYKTLFDPKAPFYHRQRTNIFSFARQIYRCGTGRANYFKSFPSQLVWKFYMTLPMLFDIYLFLFFLLAFLNVPISGILLVAYVAFLMIISYGMNKYKSRWLPFYYAAMHLSYGLGFMVGLVRGKRTWE